MKREFLQNLKVGSQALPREVIDAIMAENGKDIENAKLPPEKYTELEKELAQLKKQDPQAQLQAEKDYWQTQLREVEEKHRQQMEQLQFQSLLSGAITAAKGRNEKAITALLDVQALQVEPDREQAVAQALENLKKTDGYLFERATPPPYASGTGARIRAQKSAPTTLAGALREKMERK